MDSTDRGAAPYREVAFGPYETRAEARPDGSWRLQAPQPLGPYPERWTEHLLRWAADQPQRTFLARRSRAPGRPWQRLSYGLTLERVRALAQGLLDLGLSAERPLLLLSGNDLDHALLTLAALHVGIAVAPLSPGYALLDPQAAKVRHAVQLLTPGLVYAHDAQAFARAIEQAVPAQVPLLFGQGTLPGRPVRSMAALAATRPTAAVDAAHAAVGADTIAKFLFTSGSTQAPKAVINTHRMLCANQQMYVQCYPFLERTPPVLVDWLPWHHTAGGNSNLGLVLRNGGSLYIDEGKPTEDGMAETVANLREVSPTAIYTVPKGLEMLAQHMQHDAELRDRVFRDLRLIFAAGAAMPASVIEQVDRLAEQAIGCRVPMTMGLGMTETAPFAISHHRPGWSAGVIGLPAPGLELKLAPVDDKLEVRYRGPSVTPGYWRQPGLTAQALDDEGYFRSGDAARFIDPADVSRGLCFDGRIAEDFKLITGTWVNVGALRARALADGAPQVHDVVVTGDGRAWLGLLVFLAPAAACLVDACQPPRLTPAERAAHPAVQAWAQAWLDRLATAATGSSNRILRLVLVPDAPSAVAGELTDKGSLNPRSVLRHRAALVDALYADVPGAAVLVARLPAA